MRFQVYDLDWSTNVPLEGYHTMGEVKDALRTNGIDHGRVVDTKNTKNWMIENSVIQVRPSVRKARKRRSKSRNRKKSETGNNFGLMATSWTY
jgi:hypothetical protein